MKTTVEKLEKPQLLREYFLNAYLIAVALELAEEEAILADRKAEQLTRALECCGSAAA